MQTHAKGIMATVAGVLMTALTMAQAPAQTPAQTPEVPELVRLKQENLALRQELELAGAQLTVCRGQLAPANYKTAMDALERERQALIAEFEKANPGWTLDTATGKPVKKTGGGVSH